MGIYLTLRAEYNATGLDQRNCYGRVSNLHYHFKTKTLKGTVSIYFNKEIGILPRRVELAQKNQIVNIFQSNNGVALAGATARAFQLAGDPAYVDFGIMFHPQVIYSDTYVIPADIDTLDEAGAYAMFYEKIKQDSRFENVVDDFEPDNQGEEAV